MGVSCSKGRLNNPKTSEPKKVNLIHEITPQKSSIGDVGTVTQNTETDVFDIEFNNPLLFFYNNCIYVMDVCRIRNGVPLDNNDTSDEDSSDDDIYRYNSRFTIKEKIAIYDTNLNIWYSKKMFARMCFCAFPEHFVMKDNLILYTPEETGKTIQFINLKTLTPRKSTPIPEFDDSACIRSLRVQNLTKNENTVYGICLSNEQRNLFKMSFENLPDVKFQLLGSLPTNDPMPRLFVDRYSQIVMLSSAILSSCSTFYYDPNSCIWSHFGQINHGYNTCLQDLYYSQTYDTLWTRSSENSSLFGTVNNILRLEYKSEDAVNDEMPAINIDGCFVVGNGIIWIVDLNGRGKLENELIFIRVDDIQVKFNVKGPWNRSRMRELENINFVFV